ncbi:MAG: DUF1911 domain-containing protein [Marinilabiliaceae bacterium]|nr:DUF1911 domain-containing protein [Marinilabiliaceae bacterium]
MRDTLVDDYQYYTSYINTKEELIADSMKRIENGTVLHDRIPLVQHRIFVKSLEKLIAMYSMGEQLESLKAEYVIVLNYMVTGWDNHIVKFKKGRPQVIYDKYMLNEYCYMVWMLSLAILLVVSDKEINILSTLIENGNIDDELINLLLSALTGKKISDTSKTTYKPFEGVSKDGDKIDNKSMKKYLDKWYSNTKLLMWHNYKISVNTTKYYYGYWSFEAAAITCIKDLDDSNYRDNKYYPKDLVDYYRSNHPA